MATISFTLSDGNLARVVAAINACHPKPVGFTPTQWAKEWVRQMVIDQVYSYEQNEAVKSVQVQKDDGLLN